MKARQEENLMYIIKETNKRLDDKYRKGDIEHGGDLEDMNPLLLVDNSIDESIDQLTYLLTLRKKLLLDKKYNS